MLYLSINFKKFLKNHLVHLLIIIDFYNIIEVKNKSKLGV